MVHVNMWEASSTHDGPHGTVHRWGGCGHTRNRFRHRRKWQRANSVEDADARFSNRVLFHCSARACFGPDNPRRILRNRGRARRR